MGGGLLGFILLTRHLKRFGHTGSGRLSLAGSALGGSLGITVVGLLLGILGLPLIGVGAASVFTVLTLVVLVHFLATSPESTPES